MSQIIFDAWHPIGSKWVHIMQQVDDEGILRYYTDGHEVLEFGHHKVVGRIEEHPNYVEIEEVPAKQILNYKEDILKDE